MGTKVVTFKAEGITEREVLYVRYELNQPTNIEGQPIGTIRGGKIFLKVKSNDDGNSDLPNSNFSCAIADIENAAVSSNKYNLFISKIIYVFVFDCKYSVKTTIIQINLGIFT